MNRFPLAVFEFFCGYGHWWLAIIDWLLVLAAVGVLVRAFVRGKV